MENHTCVVNKNTTFDILPYPVIQTKWLIEA